MLAASGLSVCTSIGQLGSYLRDCKGSGKLLELRYKGAIE
jgi:hypothetical protein